MDFFYTLKGTELPALCEQAIVKFGHKKQMNQCIEEMAELTIELARLLREDVRADVGKIREEIADVLITLTQVAYICSNQEQMQEELKRKADKLRSIIYEGAN